jgi:SAM-dependent methyltransferase
VTGAARSDWADFALQDFSFVDFAPGSRVLDVGCGGGEQLESLRRAGLDAVGVEPSPALVRDVVARGLHAVQGFAEQLPVESESFDGLVCKVVLPYTDERKAIAEWARVLRPGGRVRAVYHGAGYYFRYLVDGPGLAIRIYATRALVNTWLYAATGRRLPGFVGDTIYQAASRLERYYRGFGLALERSRPSPTYRGKPVFIYHELRRLGASEK